MLFCVANSVFSNFANYDSESAADSRGVDAFETESENQYNLRSRTRRRHGSELSYDFDRDYNHIMIEKSKHHEQYPQQTNLGIRGKN